MAHPNIDARRMHVKAFLDLDIEICGVLRDGLAKAYGCSKSAIMADVEAIRKEGDRCFHIVKSEPA